MIVCKPQRSTLNSLLIFLIICYATVGWLIYQIINQKYMTFSVLGIVLLLLIAIPITLRLVLKYKFIEGAKGKIVVRHPLLFKKKIYKLSELTDLKEEQVKTYQSVYKELFLKFPNGKLSVSKQEYLGYERFKAYVDKNKPKKK